LNKKLLNIAILEPSEIIYQGLSNVLLKSGKYFQIYRINNLNEISGITHIKPLDIVIINPAQIQNKNKEFVAIKKSKPETSWVGLVYTFYDQQLLSLFDKAIHITDSLETIADLLDKLINTDTHNIHTTGYEQLSDRELEVLKLLVTGLSNKEIADKLFISIHTVVSHRKNITQKTGIKSQAGLTIYAISNKIIQIEDYQK
jgi:DNA-binding CsgD family transcriptional regulator